MIHKKILISSTSTNFKPFCSSKDTIRCFNDYIENPYLFKAWLAVGQLLLPHPCVSLPAPWPPHGPPREGAAGRHCMCSWGAQSYRKRALVAVPANKQKDTRMWAREPAWDRDDTQRMPTKPGITLPTSTFLSSPCTSTTVTPPPSLLLSSSLPSFYFHTFP